MFDTIAEPLLIQGVRSRAEREALVAEILAQVGLTPPETFMFRYPHALSGGQRQRVAIARAMVIRPRFVVADEPTSMLDVSLRAGVMDLLLGLRQELGVGYLYITHDLAVARYMCDRLAVMHLGKIVEVGPTEEVLQNPLHPYTQPLIAAVPVPDPTYKREPPEIKGDVVAPINPSPQCQFLPRCPKSREICQRSPHPPLVDRQGHGVVCYPGVNMAERYRVGDLVWARVLEILPNGALLYLDGETQGFLHLSEIAEEPVNRVEERLQEGMEVLVKVIGYDRLGRPTVSLRRVTELDREMAEFHREAVEFRALLSQRVVSLPEPQRSEERLEWRLGRWLAEAEAALSNIRRRRNERLSRALGE